MPRKLPQITSDSSAFWLSGESGRLMIHRCCACRRFFHPPAPMCPRCGSMDVAPEPTSGRGHVASYTVNQHAWKPELTDHYVVAIIELDDQPGLRLLSNIVRMPPEEVRIDMPVQICFEQQEEVWLPLFERKV